MQRTWGGLFKNWWGEGSFIQYMGNYGGRDSLKKGKGGVWEGDSPAKGKYLANSDTAARVSVYYKLSSFFPMLL